MTTSGPEVDHNIIKWTAFCESESAAEQQLQEKLLILSKKKLIVTARKQFVDSKVKPHGLFIYKFTIVTAPK